MSGFDSGKPSRAGRTRREAGRAGSAAAPRFVGRGWASESHEVIPSEARRFEAVHGEDGKPPWDYRDQVIRCFGFGDSEFPEQGSTFWVW